MRVAFENWLPRKRTGAQSCTADAKKRIANRAAVALRVEIASLDKAAGVVRRMAAARTIVD